MPISIDEFVVEVPAPETASGQQSRDAAGPAGGPPTPAWTPDFARLIEQQLSLAFERAQRLIAD